jgi:hypothetical protein
MADGVAGGAAGGCTGGVGGVGWTGGRTGGNGWAGGSGVVVQAASESATAAMGTSRLRRVLNIGDMRTMWVLMIEACVAFFLLVFIVWWTMYSGKKPVQRKPALEDQGTVKEDKAE